jgi:hypothetical protein
MILFLITQKKIDIFVELSYAVIIDDELIDYCYPSMNASNNWKWRFMVGEDDDSQLIAKIYNHD